MYTALLCLVMLVIGVLIGVGVMAALANFRCADCEPALVRIPQGVTANDLIWWQEER